MPPSIDSTDGLEAQFQTNHLGHFVLVNEVLPLLNDGGAVAARSGRELQVQFRRALDGGEA